MKIETKSRIYKTAIRPIMTYAAETKLDTTQTKRIMETAAMEEAKNHKR